eukprot:363873-Chlamydomonas_euryale.AAC.17
MKSNTQTAGVCLRPVAPRARTAVGRLRVGAWLEGGGDVTNVPAGASSTQPRACTTHHCAHAVPSPGSKRTPATHLTPHYSALRRAPTCRGARNVGVLAQASLGGPAALLLDQHVEIHNFHASGRPLK